MKKIMILICIVPFLSLGQSKKKQILRLNEIVDSLKNEISIKISENDSYKNELSLKISENDSLKKDSESFKRDVKELLLINSNLKFEIEKVIDSMNYEIVDQEIDFRGKEEDLYNKIDSLSSVISSVDDARGGVTSCGVEMIAKLKSYSYSDDDVPYYFMRFSYQDGSYKNYSIDWTGSENFDIQPEYLKKGSYYLLSLSLSYSEYTGSIYYEIINNIRHVTEHDKNILDFEPFD